MTKAEDATGAPHFFLVLTQKSCAIAYWSLVSSLHLFRAIAAFEIFEFLNDKKRLRNTVFFAILMFYIATVMNEEVQ